MAERATVKETSNASRVEVVESPISDRRSSEPSVGFVKGLRSRSRICWLEARQFLH